MQTIHLGDQQLRLCWDTCKLWGCLTGTISRHTGHAACQATRGSFCTIASLMQVALKWNIQRGVAVIPRSETPENIRSNIEGMFEWNLPHDVKVSHPRMSHISSWAPSGHRNFNGAYLQWCLPPEPSISHRCCRHSLTSWTLGSELWTMTGMSGDKCGSHIEQTKALCCGCLTSWQCPRLAEICRLPLCLKIEIIPLSHRAERSTQRVCASQGSGIEAGQVQGLRVQMRHPRAGDRQDRSDWLSETFTCARAGVCADAWLVHSLPLGVR